MDPQVSPEEIKSREVELGSESWTSFASVFTQQQCYGYFPCDCSAKHLKEQLRNTLVPTEWREATALTFWLFWQRSTTSSVSRVGARRRAFTLSPPPVPVPNKPPRFSGRKANYFLLSITSHETTIAGRTQLYGVLCESFFMFLNSL